MKARVKDPSAPHRPREDDVARLVADQQRAHDTRWGCADVDDADAVREVVDDPDLRVRPRRHCDRLQTHLYGAQRRDVAIAHRKELETTVWRVQRQERLAIG
jgi:hypothetical protein